MQFTTSDETCAYVRSQTDTVILGYSTGKDSIAAWLQLRKFWTAEQIIPICQLFVPGPPENDGRGALPYMERILAQHEQWLGRKIYRVPHMSFYATMAGKVWQPPERLTVLEELNTQGFFPVFDYHDYNEWIKSQTGLYRAWVATGIKANDNIYRRKHIASHGSVLPGRQTFYPVWDWNKAQLMQAIADSPFSLSVEYEWFGRSFSGIDARFTWMLKDKSPEDYRVLKFWYPLCDLDHFRMTARSRLLAQQAQPRRKVKLMDDPDDRFLGLDGVEQSLQDGVAEIAQAIKAGQIQAARPGMHDNLDTRFWTALVFQTDAAKREFLEKAGLAAMGNKYLSGEEVARRLGIELTTPIPGEPNWRVDKNLKDLT